ncbi:MAG TPA: OsmC family protein [Chitinophagaceae bacterium]|nr:OsmC family protein [Chitinophagaceae bacterium]MCB9055547.1 OsmC family protein [Chitinophagales bacterium]HPG10600.1 OsmC family protein [Chitinophagaceae bacterium]HRX93269.1 OsmC family protein [Chitinophagaceae bacterium]
MKSFATANWKGSGKEGSGTLSSKSKVLENTAYDYRSRFEDGTYTNPEELVAAAHAGCFSMKLSFVLGAAGFTPDSIDTKCTVTLENGTVTSSHLEVKATVPGIDAEKFAECATEAKDNCPISKLLSTEISLDAALA